MKQFVLVRARYLEAPQLWEDLPQKRDGCSHTCYARDVDAASGTDQSCCLAIVLSQCTVKLALGVDHGHGEFQGVVANARSQSRVAI